MSGFVLGPGHKTDPVVPAFNEFMRHGGLTLSICSQFDELPDYKGINRKQFHFSPVTGPNCSVSDPRVSWSHCYYTAICSRSSSQGQVKAFLSFVSG